ncbi:hypothetical protein [Bacillus sp. EB600]|uniref:hypothetical protein n=1 Tax=Bacillus sp. EB600 TaxID=2806345 RepID=UPI00210E360A|nr:hypothetical protein [Bacillus sp. EB600]MCQ6279963.1 hypothetical protein [Bacillus sp. EB600]
MNNWITSLFTKGRRQPLLNMFGRRRNTNGMIWWGSLLGLGVSAAAYGLSRNQNKNMLAPFQNLMNNTRVGKNVQQLNMAGLTEFAKELAPNKNQFNNK